MRRWRRHEEEEKTDRWVVSYADFITLLFAFFATLYAISAVDLEKLGEFASSLNDALHQGVVRGDAILNSKGVVPIPEVNERVEAGIRGIFKGSPPEVEMRRDARGVIVSLGESFLFEPGKTELNDRAVKKLSELALFLKGIENRVMIEGHTDNLPPKDEKVRSNWILSAERAYTVMKLFVDRFGISPERLILAGYGPYRPLRENTTPEGRAKNRRVDIVILKEGY
ncbi:MAG: hypothetical protein D6726_10615 [Nitrospirae bacterium]|nr:MAG: hypothetical protein D6726_10615 [Nitrospirota bacterium]